MSKFVSTARHGIATLVLGALALGLVVSGSVLAPGAAHAAQQVSAEVFKHLEPAQAALKSRNFAQALSNADAALEAAKTQFERDVAQQIKFQAAFNLRRWQDVAESGEALLKSPSITGQQRVQFQRTLGSVYVQLRQYDKALDYTRQAMAASGGGTAADQQTLFAIYQVRGDCQNSLAALDRLLGGRPADEKQLSWRLNCMVRSKDPRRVAVAEELLRRFPKKDYFAYVVSQYAEQKLDARAMLNVYRFGFERDLFKGEDEFLAHAQAALDAGFSIEAQRVLERGMKSGAVKKGDVGARSSRLIASAQGLSTEERKKIPQLDKEARAGRNGEADVNLGIAYFGMGEYQKAVEALQRGLGADRVQRVRRPDDANMVLGIALTELKRRPDAQRAFSAAQADPRMAKAATLWLGG
ncbi:MAG: hypothetical protein ACK53C_13630 [Pseudomonadota bacterium]